MPRPMQDDYIPGYSTPQPEPDDNNPFATILFGNHDDADHQLFEQDDDGNMRIVLPDEEMMPATVSTEHGDNLAVHLSASDKLKLSSTLIELIDEDIESRKPWVDRFRDGFKMMGLTKDEIDDGPFPGSSTAVMPLISEAVVQFWAKSLAELVPPQGPCRGTVLGKSNTLALDRATRVADYQNHDMMFLDRGWYNDMSRMLFALPYTGSTFKKTYRDEQMGTNVGEYVKAEDFICNHAMSDLQSSPRYTHRLWRTRNQLRKAQLAAIYVDEPLQQADAEDLSEEAEIKVESQDFEPGSTRSEDSRYELYEVYCEWDFAQFPHLDDKGKPTQIEVPYIVTIERRSGTVLSVYRDWKEHDPLCRRRVIFTKYDFLPSDGFYGWGFFHLIGGLQQAATGALRAIIDGAATASLQGGFVTADASLKDQKLELEPGVWKQVNSSAEDLTKAFWSPPFKEPSAVLYQVLTLLMQRVEKFAATTEMQTGTVDAKNMPVGSTVAMLEAGSKVFSTIHKGLHKALSEEERQRFELIQAFMPPNGYPYDVEGGHQGIMAQDFAPGVQVVPVSDPNIFSDTQRVAQNQAVYDLAVQNPGIIDRKKAVIRVLKGIKVPDVEDLLISSEPPPPMDPVSEIQSLLRGQPVQAYPDQDHAAYLQHYWSFMNNPQFGGNPQVQQQIGPAAMALIGQRLAYAWATAVRQHGIPAPMLPPPMQPQGQEQGPGPAPGAMGPQGQLPPQQQLGPDQIAQMVTQITGPMTTAPGMPPPPTQEAGPGGGLTADQEAHFRDRETSVLEAKGAADVAGKQADTAAKTKAADIKAQQEAEKLNEIQDRVAIAQDREDRLQKKDADESTLRGLDAADRQERTQQSREAHALTTQQQDEAHQTQQQTEQVRGALETARLARETQDASKQAALDQTKTAADVKLTQVKTKQAAKAKPAPKKPGGK